MACSQQANTESTVMGILVDVSGSMRNSVSAGGRVEGANVTWARSIFNVVDELIKHDVPSSNQTFTLAFGSPLDCQVFDLLSTLRQAKKEQLAMETLKSKGKRKIIDEVLSILMENGARRVRTWAHMNILLKVMDHTTAASMLYYLQRNPEFTERFVHDILPQECREIVMTPSNLIFEGAYYLVGCVSQTIQESATEESVKDVMEEGKQLMEEFRMKDVDKGNTIVPVDKAEIMSVQSASEILHDSVGDQELTDERVNELMETVEPYIYGGTPLIRAMRHSKELFSHPEFKNHKKILFILSDGEADGNDTLLQALSDLGVTIVSCFITHEGLSDPRHLYSILDESWEKPAKFMFGISSVIKTQEIPRTLFAKEGWKIDIDNNETKLFFQVNHPDVIKDVCDMTKRAVLSQDALSDVLADVDLNVYINKANDGFKPKQQHGGTCYANASAAVMHLAMKRIVGRDGGYPDFFELRKKLINKYGEKGAPTIKVLREVCPEYRLQCERVDTNGAKKAITEKRPVVARFYLTGAQWDQFSQFYQEKGKEILTKSYLNSKRGSTSDPGGHAVVLTSYDAESLRLMNSWGDGWADSGFFRVQNSDVLGLEFFDVYWTLNDLSKKEKEAYKKSGAKVAGNLMKSLKGLQEAKYKCPLCPAESKVVEYSGHALNAECPKCRGTFNPNKGGGDLALNLYLTSLMC
ncbi:uncharacterized protein [Montipora foliosa]|uniref:uncharacterized protein n=1 Tax=Montipora foliosa TaxID=591990 RepID=UPI0035F114B2